ncbi:MAG: peptidoglycan DD-metalloendopeptidase family protein [Bacteroidota bacterium]|nr:peptidoglycan DD-metalloendopeptidase family protein [Bacteroidota bacterium]
MPKRSRPYAVPILLLFLLGGCILAFGMDSALARSRKHPKKKPKKVASKIHTTRLSREAELAKLKREIAETERELREHTQRERRTVKSLAAYDRKTQELKRKLASLRDQAADLESQVEELDVSIENTASSIDTLKSAYAASVTSRYKTGIYRSGVGDSAIFSDPEAGSEKIRRAYLSHIVSTAFHRNKNELDSTKTTLTENKEEVSATLSEELSQIDAAKREQMTTEQKKRAQAEELKKIQSSKQALQKELDKRKASAKRLEAIIANLVAKEEAQRKAAERELKRRMAERKKKRSSGKKLSKKEQQEESQDKIEAKNLAGPHSLGWPTSSHRIVQSFGEHRNAELGTVTMNLGVDIGTASGSAVRSAGDGVVSLISSLPSYGTIMIIRHGGGVHSVYANLSGVSVSSGSKVSKGQTIASSGSNSELGPILHFEVWKGKSKQNPLRWLK